MDQQTPTTARLTAIVFVAAVVAVVITVIVASVVMNTSLGPKVAIPGPLAVQHALLTNDCANCHSADMDSTKGVLHGIVNSELSLRDSGRCLDCHDLGEHALQSHAMSPAAIEERTQRIIDHPALSAIASASGFNPPHSKEGEFACAVCHVEHGGRWNDLTAMTDAQCQSCHSIQFDSFHKGHPEFDSYPYRRRLRIAFDHASHIYNYFPAGEQGQAPASCTDCHHTDATGKFMMTASFAQGCAQCHDNDVHASQRSAGSGVQFFTLPAIDTIAIDDAGIGIGQWPADSGIAEGEITPFMRLMLGGDPTLRSDLRIADSLDLHDLQDATDEQLVAVGRIIWAIKALAWELARDGHAALLWRTTVAVGADTEVTLSSHLAGGLSRPLMRESIEAWLPDLEDELARHAAGDDPSTDALEDASFDEVDASGQEWASQGGWYRDDMAFALRYRPAGHGDAFLRAWADLAATWPTPGGPVLHALKKPDAVGQCFRCHSVDQTSHGSMKVNWRARQPQDTISGLTRFNHAPHLPLLDDDGCLQCHAIETQPRDFELAYAQFDPNVFNSAIAPMSQTDCAACHTPTKVAMNCLGCHNYHSERPMTRLRTGAPLKPSAAPEKTDANPGDDLLLPLTPGGDSP